MTEQTIRERAVDENTDVVVIGAGPVGLATALQLGRLGVSTQVFERRTNLSSHPKAGGIHARTLEIFRRWGIADKIRELGSGDPARAGGAGGFAWVTRLKGIELGRIEFGGSAEDLARWATFSPEGPAFCGQDIYEPILFGAAAAHEAVRIELGRRAEVLDQRADGVLVNVVNAATGQIERTVEARYVIAADGVRSATRRALGVGETGERPFGEEISVQFEADLERHRAGRPYTLFWVVNQDTLGAFVWRRHATKWLYNFERAPDKDPTIFTVERCKDIIRKAAGDPDLDIKIDDILHWRHEQAVTEKWRVGRVFFVGDSAHRFPPHGGFGMNSGVQDSVNLVWKIDLALKGLADDALLDTYEIERKPVAEFNGAQSLENTRRMEETGWLLFNPDAIAKIEAPGPEGQAIRDRIAEAVPRQREQFYSFGQQFGSIYRSAAVILDGSDPEPSTVSDYRITAHPGARAPHLWLRGPDGRDLSTIDLFYDGFVVLAGPEGEPWRDAASVIGAESGVRLKGYVIGEGGDLAERPGERSFTTVYGIDADGAVLVRPDGHVAFRSKSGVDAARPLREALGHLLSPEAAGAAAPRKDSLPAKKLAE